jgi:hypothetical protein
MTNYLTGTAIMEGRNLQPFQLLNLVSRGLTPYDAVTGQEIPFLNEAEYWLYKAERLLWQSAGLIMLLHDSGPTTALISPEIQERLPAVFYRALTNLSRVKPPESKLYETDFEGRPPKGLLPKLEDWLLSLLPPKYRLNQFPVTRALLQAASPDLSIYNLAFSLNALGDSGPGPPGTYDLEFGIDLLLALFQEQNNAAHPRLTKMLETPPEAMAAFCENYLTLAPGFTRYRPLKFSESKLYWERHYQESIPYGIRQWAGADNRQRLFTLSLITRMIRPNFPDSPWPHRSLAGFILGVPHEDSSSRLAEAVYPAEQAAVAANFPSPTTGQPASIAGQSPNLARHPAAPEPDPAPEINAGQPENLAHWAAVYRTHKDQAFDQTTRDLWEIMALRLEGQTNLQIHALVYPAKSGQGKKINTLKADISKKIPQARNLLAQAGLPILLQFQPQKKF